MVHNLLLTSFGTSGALAVVICLTVCLYVSEGADSEPIKSQYHSGDSLSAYSTSGGRYISHALIIKDLENSASVTHFDTVVTISFLRGIFLWGFPFPLDSLLSVFVNTSTYVGDVFSVRQRFWDCEKRQWMRHLKNKTEGFQYS